MQRGFALPVLIIGIVIAVTALGGVYYLGTKRPEQNTKPLPDSLPENTINEATNWKTYNGKYFSFNYPYSWSDNTNHYSSNNPNILEEVGLRISPNAVLEVSYINDSYEEQTQSLVGRKSSSLKILDREAMRFELEGSGHPLPKGFSIISFVVKGQKDTSYSIVFNGDKKDITEELIGDILNSFKFTN